jgi:hypothetical protein
MIPGGTVGQVLVKKSNTDYDTEWKNEGESVNDSNNTPIVSYIYTSNPEITVTSVDVDTNTFASVAHGLSNEDLVAPALNVTADTVFPRIAYPGGLLQMTYYIVNATADTFQLSLTSGGVAINLTTNGTMDLTKWHFEKSIGISSILINELPAAKQYRVKVRQRFGCYTYLRLSPSSPIDWRTKSFIQSGIPFGSGKILNEIAYTSQGGFALIDALFSTETNKLAISENIGVMQVQEANTGQFTLNNVINNGFESGTSLNDTTITAFTYSTAYPLSILNGTIIEVYGA